MTPVKSAADLAIGDAVEVGEYEYRGMPPKPRRGVVEKVGKVAALVRFIPTVTLHVRYVKRVTVDGAFHRGKRKANHYPLSKLSARDIWIAERPNNDRVWGGGNMSPTIIASATAVRDELDLVIEDLRKYSEWLQREPKDES